MANNKNKSIRIMGILFIGLALCSCGSSDQESAQISTTDLTPSKSAPNPEINVKPAPADSALENSTPLTTLYLNLAQQHFNSTCSAVIQLQQTMQQFVLQPSEKGLNKMKAEWLTSHHHYASTQFFRNINIKHPVYDQSKNDPVQHPLTIRIDQTPLLPGYIDEIKGYPKSGYIFSTLPIDRETVNKEHQFADSAYVLMGFHAIEFLLWGEGNRTYQGFSPLPSTLQEGDDESPALFNIRRSELLSLTTNVLAEDLSTLCKEWDMDTGFYATTLKALTTEEQDAAINAATEQLISSLQINTAKIRQATDNNEESIRIEPHSEFSNSDEGDIKAQISVLKALVDSNEWLEAGKQQEHTKKLTQLAKALLL